MRGANVVRAFSQGRRCGWGMGAAAGGPAQAPRSLSFAPTLGQRHYCTLMCTHSQTQKLTRTRAPELLRFSRRTMFIQTQSTPNPLSLKFVPGKSVLEPGNTMDFDSYKSAQQSPLAKSIFAVEGVTRVFFTDEYISVTMSNDADWLVVKPHVFAAITDFYASGTPVLAPLAAAPEHSDTAITDQDSETVAFIKELIETRIRPNVQEDGGDIKFIKFDELGTVWLQMQGSCAGCPSSSVTLKNGIESMLMYYVEEVNAVEEWLPEGSEAGGKKGEDASSSVASVLETEDLKKLQEGLAKVPKSGGHGHSHGHTHSGSCNH